ncbi:Ger(x)C family spore germination protein [Clostridium lundense]|uniref:Ger(x)C family spore germination protein n=1 Tax=Clostridium lundense TaxID=319475 RepID=UPI000485C726|nr:Ger(x)C family spore germination protein [Clostridium lundense]
MIKKIYKSLCIMLIFMFTIIFSGCWDYADIEKRGIYVSIGVDKLKDEVELISEVAGFKTSLSKDPNKSNSSNIYKIISYGPNFEDARFIQDRKSPFPIFLGAVKTVIFSENYAKDGILPYINRINRIYNYRKTVIPVVTKESPKEIFNLNVPNNLSAGFLIEDIIRSSNAEGKGIYIDFSDVLNIISLKHMGFVLPYLGIDNELITYLGSAIMNEESRLIDVININKSKGLLYLLSNNPNLTEYVSLHDNSNLISISPISFKKNIKTKYIDNKVVINIDLKLKEKLDYSYKEMDLNDNDLSMLENETSKKIKGYITSIIKKAQEEYKCDIFQFLRYFRAQNPVAYKTIDWKKEFPKAEVNVNVNTKIVSKNFYDYESINKSNSK